LRQVREIAFDSNAHSLDSVKRAAYRLMGHFSTEFRVDGPVIRAVLHFKVDDSEDAIDAIVEAFRKEVLDQDLRASIKAETESVRNLILAHAFSRTSLVQK
jgi:His-Xaa-Ser system protein HxsD